MARIVGELRLTSAAFRVHRFTVQVRGVPSSIDHLLRCSRRYPLLSPAQEIELGRAIRRWQDWPGGPSEAPPEVQRLGKASLDRFVLSNIRLAYQMARRYRNRGVSEEDLSQAAIEGLITAYSRFKPELGFRSSSYACWYIQQRCQMAVAQQGTGLKLPTTVSEALRSLHRITTDLRGQLGRPPTDLEIAKAAKLKASQLDALRLAARNGDLLSLDQPLTDGGMTIGETLDGGDAPAERLERDELHQGLRQLVFCHQQLTPQQRFILRCRFFLDPTPSLARIASQLNLSRETIRRQERLALEKLRWVLPEGSAGCLNPS